MSNDRHSLQPYSLRLPRDLREKLENSANQGDRSLHAEILRRLQASFDPSVNFAPFPNTPDEKYSRYKWKSDEPLEKIAEIRQMLDEILESGKKDDS